MVFAERRSSARNDPAFLLAILYTWGFFGFIFCTILVPIPESNQDLVKQLLPVLSMIQGGIVQYFYTKSQQLAAEKKDETISKFADVAKIAAASTPPIPADTKVDKMNVEAETVVVKKD